MYFVKCIGCAGESRRHSELGSQSLLSSVLSRKILRASSPKRETMGLARSPIPPAIANGIHFFRLALTVVCGALKDI